MPRLPNPPLGVSIALGAVSVLLAVPHVYRLVKDLRRDAGYIRLGSENEDETITFAKPPRSIWQRVTLVLVAAIATIAAVWSWVTAGAHSTDIANIIIFASWILVFLQETILATRQQPQDRYRLGCYSAWSNLLLGAYIALPYALALYTNGSLTLTQEDALPITQLFAALTLFFTNLSLPRGPTLHRNNLPIDAEGSVSVLTRYTFAWAFPTLALATRNNRLERSDLPLIPAPLRAHTLCDAFYARDPYSVAWRKWFRLYWRPFTTQLVIQLFANAVHFLPNLLLLTILRLFEERDAGETVQLKLWLTAVALGSAMMAVSWLTSLRDFVADLHISIPVNEQLFAVISRKALALKDVVVPAKSNGDSSSSDDDSDSDSDDEDEESGESNEPPRTKHSILNLLGVDVMRISDFDGYSHLLLDCVLEFGITIGFLVFLMGWKPTLGGCLIPLFLTPLYYTITKKYSATEQTLMNNRDEKSASLTEMVRGMRQVKFSALESEWRAKILKLRNKELKSQADVFRLNIYLSGIWILGPICMSFLAIASYIYFNGSISASTAFTALSLFESLQTSLSQLPEVITDLLDTFVSLGRISRFLGLEEHTDGRVSAGEIALRDATITWPLSPPEEKKDDSDDENDNDNETGTQSVFQLRNLNLDIPQNDLTVISGRSGSGKSLLLQALIGEADILSGTVTVPQADTIPTSVPGDDDWLIDGAIAYVSQDPWIENASIRDAILFGLPLNHARYEEVIHACALTQDLKIFPDGDKTDIGANGINLSGGQKWRLSLARALYSRASILVLDDIFSAVDAHVGRHLYENALTGKLSEGRTRILATHHVKLCLDSVAYHIELENGSVLRAHRPTGVSSEEASEVADDGSETATENNSPEVQDKPMKRRDSIKASKFYEDEKRETGVVKAAVYKAYIQASGGNLHWILIAVFFVADLILSLSAPYWVSVWTRSYEQNTVDSLLVQDTDRLVPVTTSPRIDKRLVYYGGIYLAISLSSWIMIMIRMKVVLGGSIRASSVMFEQFTDAILRSPLRFLDTTPVGQILNRFTSDFGVLDSDLSLTMAFAIYDLVAISGVVIAAILSSPLVVGLGVLSLFGSWTVAYFYATAAREAKRLESIAKSPIFDLVGSLLTGLPTIRAFGREQAYLARMYDLIDTHCQAFWHRRLFRCWMAFWLAMVGALFVTSVTMVFVSIRTLDAPLAGFALSFALHMSESISYLLMEYAQLEIEFNATERIVEYTKLEKEPATGIDVPAAWPTKGELEVTDLTVAYAPDLPPVLRELNFTLRQGERVGVVGRTGAGKSSLAMALLRCLDIRSGSIHIDGIDVSSVKLHDLRSRVGMISQDPIVFTGTVREVLDPFSQHDDSELIDALEKVALTAPNQSTTTPTDTPQNPSQPLLIPLSFPIAESGRNLSQGQRQLLCLARALVSRPKILIMDEATASIDMESDMRIQRVLREEIRGSCTLLVIAHRLSTIADFEKVVVLDAGRVVEMGTPRELMELQGEEDGAGGVFRGMVEGSGERAVIRGMIFGEEGI
ncbi:P-loop containing nucleoside triphosphate hydrolase protein [Aspergillus carlsbadensis]|nr:P-loop containing nucleoside triphosphate hydrolase protein [Aspergillus carlsbadensis]